jgi:hypothetical protein
MNADPLKAIVGKLPEPVPPSQMERVVMARIAQAGPARHVAGAGKRVASPRPAPARDWLDVFAWVGSVTGLVLFVGAWIAGHVASGALVRAMESPAAANAVLVKMPMNVPAILGLAVGAALYVLGLFARSRPT